MNRNEPLTDQLIEAAFARRADRVSPATVGTLGRDILAATASTRQRSVLGLRLSSIRPRYASRTAWVALAVLAALLGVVLALAFTGHRQPAPFRTPLLAYVRDGDVYLANSDGSNPELVLHQDGTGFVTVAWAPTEDRLAVDGDAGAVLIDAATGGSTFVGGSNPVWSPDGRELAVLDMTLDGSGSMAPVLRIVDIATGATIHTYPFPAIGGLAWSPNGRWIAATGGSSGSNSLVRIDVTTGKILELDGPSGMLDSTREPAWSPDSLHIAFIRWGAEGLCRGLPLCETDVFVANADGSDPVRLNRVPATADEPSWSPDGLWIAYRQVDRTKDAQGGGGPVADGATGIVIVHPDATGERTIKAAGVGAIAWSTDSKHLLFIRSNGRGSAETIWEASLDGVAQAVDAAIGPSPDLFERTGSRFAWQSVVGGRDIPALPALTQPTPAAVIVVITPPPSAPADPSGTWPTLATVSDDGCRPMTVAMDTGTIDALTNVCDDSGSIDTWQWSPTGSAFAAIRGGTLTVVQEDGRVALNVAGLTGLTQVSWSPDGEWLSVTGAKSWLLRPDGSDLREIPGGEATWSPDGGTLAVATPDGQLLVGGPDGSDLHAIGAFPVQLSWSPDASRFAFIRDGNAWTATRDGTDLHNVTALPLGGASDVTWSFDGRWLAVSASHGLWLVELDGSARTWVSVGFDASIAGLAWSPSATKLAIGIVTDGIAAPQQSYIDLFDPTGSPAIRIDDATDLSWSPDGRFLAVGVANTDAQGTRNLVLMNEDGSGRHAFPMPPSSNPFIWVR